MMDPERRASRSRRDRLDAIVNSFTLHEIYSSQPVQRSVRLSPRCATSSTYLKSGRPGCSLKISPCRVKGMMTIEIPDESACSSLGGVKSRSPIFWLNIRKRPGRSITRRTADFYLEELPARYPADASCSACPAKWAHEFILRKDDLENWDSRTQRRNIPSSPNGITAARCAAMGARVLYTAPHWDEQVIKARFRQEIQTAR
jgi:hypothetical protein